MNFYCYLEQIGEAGTLKEQVKELNEFINDIEEYKHIEKGKGELESLETYYKELYLRAETIANLFNQYERKGVNKQ